MCDAYAAGNHESAPVNLFAPHYAPRSDWASGWLYSFLGSSDAWLRWLPQLTDEERSQIGSDIANLGSYSVRVQPPASAGSGSGSGSGAPALRVISLNMNYCHDKVPSRSLVLPLDYHLYSYCTLSYIRVYPCTRRTCG